jgi:hypothetical protein
MYRFGQNLELMSLSAGVLQQISRSGLSGEEQDLAGWQEIPDVDGSFDAIHVRHDNVADYKVWFHAPGTLYGTRTCVHGRCVKTVLIENDRQGICNNPLIINNQDFRLWLVIGHVRSPNLLMQLWPAKLLASTPLW